MIILPGHIKHAFADPRRVEELKRFTIAMLVSMAILGVGGVMLYLKATETPDHFPTSPNPVTVPAKA